MWSYGNILEHTGVKGMHWGVHKKKASKQSIKIPLPDISKMSDEELRKTVNRLQMEKQYSQLAKKDVSKGRAYVNNVIKTGTTIAAVTTTALTLYNNTGKIRAIIEPKLKKARELKNLRGR